MRSAPSVRRPRCSPASRSLPGAPATRCCADSKPFSAGIADTRLALEVAIIQTYAERLTAMLRLRDPLSERVHLGKAGVAGLGLVGLIWGAIVPRRPGVLGGAQTAGHLSGGVG